MAPRTWWDPKASPKERAELCKVAFEACDKQHTDVRAGMAVALKAYTGREVATIDSVGWTLQRPQERGSGENIIRSAGRAATAKISTNRPRPSVQTNKADWTLQRKARDLALFLEAIIREAQVFATMRQAFEDAWWCPMAPIKVWPDYLYKAIRVDRVLRSDLVWDALDARGGMPRSLYQLVNLDREQLRAMIPPDKMSKAIERAIASAELARGAKPAQFSGVSDPVSVVEAWHLPSGPDAGDGRRLWIVTGPGSDAPLVDADWKRDHFPFGFWRYSRAPMGLDGVSAYEDLRPFQDRQDELNERIDRMLAACSHRLFQDIKSLVSKEQLQQVDSENPVTYYQGIKPEWNHDPGPPAAVLGERERNLQAAYEQMGMSQLTARQALPAGVVSAVAQQEVKDTESQRFLDVGQAWEELMCSPPCGLAELILDAADDLADAGINLEVLGPQGRALRPIRYSEIREARKNIRLGISPASMLPREAAGKLERVQTLISIFPMAAPMVAKLLDHPDIDQAVSIATSTADLILYDLEQLEDGLNPQPDPFMDKDLGRVLALQWYQMAKAGGAPETVLQAGRNYINAIQDLVDSETEQAAPGAPGSPAGPAPLPGPGGPGAPGGGPGAGPAAPPGQLGPDMSPEAMAAMLGAGGPGVQG